MRYRRKTDVVEAMQLTKSNREEVIKFVGAVNVKTKPWDPKNLYLIKGPREDDFVEVGSYVIKRENGFEVLPPAIFQAMYEEDPVVPVGLKK